MIRLTFTGDIMSSQTQNEAVFQKYGEYNYSDVFYNLKEYFKHSDFLCGNLETPLGFDDYTTEPASFNTPIDFAKSLKEVGFDMLTTANNHVMDRGKSGLIKTINALDDIGIEHTGTYLTVDENNKIVVKDFNGCKIAYLSFTYGTNSEYHQNILKDDDCYMIDMLRRQALPITEENNTKQKVKRIIKTLIPNFVYQQYLKVRGVNQNYMGQLDNVEKTEISNKDNDKYLYRCIEKVKKAKDISDIVIVCCHAGGQYNNTIGAYTTYIFEKIAEAGADIIVGNHPHCILPYDYDKLRKCMKFYSLGNFSFTPGGRFYVDNVYSDFSILLNVCVDTENKRISHYTFSVLHVNTTIEGISQTNLFYNEYITERDKNIRSEMISKNYEVIKRFLKKEINTMQKEYTININQI